MTATRLACVDGRNTPVRCTPARDGCRTWVTAGTELEDLVGSRVGRREAEEA